MKPNKKILKIHPLDNLIVALSDLNKGEIFNIGNKKIKLKTDVKAKHKFAIDNLNLLANGQNRMNNPESAVGSNHNANV